MLVQRYPRIGWFSVRAYFRRQHFQQANLNQNLERAAQSGSMWLPDSTVLRAFGSALSQAEFDKGYLFESFPGTVVQVNAVAQALQARSPSLADWLVIVLSLPFEECAKRADTRLVCQTCDGGVVPAVWQEIEGIPRCANCGGEVSRRPEDSIDVFQQRYSAGLARILPTIEYLETRSLVRRLDATRSPEQLLDEVVDAIEYPFAG
jgi:adenylate kinase